MNSIACAIFFIVGCFGQQNIGPSTPSLNSVTSGSSQLQNGTPNLPLSSGGVPGLPQQPNGITNMPSFPNGTPGFPQPPNGITNMPSLPNGMPGFPQSPNGTLNMTNGVPFTPAPEILERPCRPNELSCIRRYFEHHSKCRPSQGWVPDPLLRAISNQFYPRVNLTETNLNSKYSGFNNGRIREFYINRDTDKLVIAIELRDLKKSSYDTFFRYHRRGKEPIITHGYASVVFRSLVVTLTIPQVDNLRLDKADCFAYSDEANPNVVLDPRLGESSDPIVPETFAAFRAGMPINVVENLLTESSFMGATFILYVICDFGLKLI